MDTASAKSIGYQSEKLWICNDAIEDKGLAQTEIQLDTASTVIS